ncbi:hypothetical protein CEF21_03905 [Bacillus sp. FJAT-42376]|uniref:hypothetical protein n=1 Tax=Bacillus sp. FJAT-42376 TaxID=2014076 RepID=UPI000F4F116D|nr:hypothetical protein [Bacillus sp. FJAT-42376]AZB41508.1 hypothetical protein CEF21_03905 [Bacillus sp. FJAT-42376]
MIQIETLGAENLTEGDHFLTYLNGDTRFVFTYEAKSVQFLTEVSKTVLYDMAMKLIRKFESFKVTPFGVEAENVVAFQFSKDRSQVDIKKMPVQSLDTIEKTSFPAAVFYKEFTSAYEHFLKPIAKAEKAEDEIPREVVQMREILDLLKEQSA